MVDLAPGQRAGWKRTLDSWRQPSDSQPIVCEGTYRYHLQGITGDQKETLYWSFTTTLVKTDMSGRVLVSVPVPYHHGDLCYANGKVYVAYSNLFDKPGADSKVYIYKAEDLSLLEVKSVPEVTYGAGGMEYHKGHFFIVGGLPPDHTQNYVYEYDSDFNHMATHTIASGYTFLGIQTVCFHYGYWWFGCYGEDKRFLKTDEAFNLLGVYDVDAAIGIVGWDKGRFLVARHFETGESWRAKAIWARADDELGLAFE